MTSIFPSGSHAENNKKAFKRNKNVLIADRENEIRKHKWLYPVKCFPFFSSLSFAQQITNYSHQ